MKIKDGFLLRDVAGDTVVIPSGRSLDLNMMMTLNESARVLWERLETECDETDLIAVLRQNYEVSENQAQQCVADFLKTLKENDLLQ